jgi:hypothetical protein
MTRRPRQYRLTRDLPAGTPENCFPRDLKAGEVLSQCSAAYVTSLSGDDGVMLTDSPDGDYPGYEVSPSALEVVSPAPAAITRQQGNAAAPEEGPDYVEGQYVPLRGQGEDEYWDEMEAGQ